MHTTKQFPQHNSSSDLGQLKLCKNWDQERGPSAQSLRNPDSTTNLFSWLCDKGRAQIHTHYKAQSSSSLSYLLVAYVIPTHCSPWHANGTVVVGYPTSKDALCKVGYPTSKDDGRVPYHQGCPLYGNWIVPSRMPSIVLFSLAVLKTNLKFVSWIDTLLTLIQFGSLP